MNLEGHCCRIVGEGSDTHYMGHFEAVHTEQDYFAQERRKGQGLEVRSRRTDSVEADIEGVLVESYLGAHKGQEAGHIVEEPAGNLGEGRIVEDILGGHYKEVRCRKKDHEAVHMIEEDTVDIL